MIIIKNNFIPFGRYTTMNLYGLLFTKRNNLKDDVINHEGIHSVQILELAIVGILFTLLLIFIFKISYWYLLFGGSLFYIWYLIEYIFVRLFHKKQNDGYHDISLEEEAYNNEDNMNYLNNRKLFAWFKYIKPKSFKK